MSCLNLVPWKFSLGKRLDAWGTDQCLACALMWFLPFSLHPHDKWNSFLHQLCFTFNKNISGIPIPLFLQVHSLTETFPSSKEMGGRNVWWWWKLTWWGRIMLMAFPSPLLSPFSLSLFLHRQNCRGDSYVKTLFLQQLKNTTNLTVCSILVHWVFSHGYAVPYMCCPGVYQGVGFGENFQLETLHLGDSISWTGRNCSAEIITSIRCELSWRPHLRFLACTSK